MKLFARICQIRLRHQRVDRAIFILSLYGLRRGEIAGMKLKYVTPTSITIAGQGTNIQRRPKLNHPSVQFPSRLTLIVF